MNPKRYSLGKNGYAQKPVSIRLIKAATKIQKFLQEEENRVHGRKAQEVTFAYVTDYIYENFMKGRRIE